MTALAKVPGVKPRAVEAWDALVTAARDRAIPCAGDDRLMHDDPDVRAEAGSVCEACPIFAECRRFADLNEERFGVWAGRDYTRGAASAAKRQGLNQ